MALLVFLARAAGAGIVAADFGTFTHDGLGEDLALGEEPGAIPLLRKCLLVMFLAQAALDVCRLEFDHAFFVRGSAFVCLQYLEAEPGGSLAPSLVASTSMPCSRREGMCRRCSRLPWLRRPCSGCA